jgi:hypothetical protein
MTKEIQQTNNRLNLFQGGLFVCQQPFDFINTTSDFFLGDADDFIDDINFHTQKHYDRIR